jgi:3-deoxy-manno-octulosonate cytidylyltransferase (CMP-KDO synthetase)
MPSGAAIVIPARLAATRLPGKPLVELGGLPLIVRVERQARKARLAARVLVATDAREVLDAVSRHGGDAVMTGTQHASGTDRVAEVAARIDAEILVNLQGDEPFLQPSDLDAVIDALMASDADMATLRVPIDDHDDLDDPNVVKVVCRDDGRALYFSRAPIPFDRDKDLHGPGAHRHLGIYAYRRAALERLAATPVHPLERRERLEQLRALATGMTIAVCDGRTTARGIDTREDLAWARARVEKLGEDAFP